MRISRRHWLQSLAVGSLLSQLPTSQASAQASGPPLFMDGHLDLGWNMVNYGRDYRLRAEDIRTLEGPTIAGEAMLGLPNLFEGGVGLLFGVIFTMPRRSALVNHRATYTNADEAYEWGQRMMAAIDAFAESAARVRIIHNAADLDAVLATWDMDQPTNERLLGIVLAMEGADPILTPDSLVEWVDQGLRCIGLSWARTRYAGGNNDPGDLTELGHDLLREMQTYNLLLDTAHLSEAAFWQTLDLWDGPVIYSHGNSRYFLPGERGLSDAQIDALVERDGVVGIGLYNGFFQQNRISANAVTLGDVANAIDYICQRAGSCAHVAIGSDIDGGFGAEASPIDTASDLPHIADILAQRGYMSADLAAIRAGNWLRQLRRVL